MVRVQPAIKEKIKQRTDYGLILERLGVGHWVQRSSEIRCRCPIHKGDGYNFSWNMETGIWTCFSHHCGEDAGKPRDVFLLVELVMGISFLDAARTVGGWLGFSSEDFVYDKEEDDRYKIERWLRKQSSLGEAKPESMDESILDEFDKTPHPYLLRRGFTEETIKTWDIRYAPDGYFANRVVIPIRDENGQIVGLSGRLTTDDPDALKRYGKYKNLMDVANGVSLFGLHRAKLFVPVYQALVITEGQFDVVMAHQKGLCNVVATMGSSILPEQVNLVIRHTDTVYLAFDGDEAGRRATKRVYERLKPFCDVKILPIPEGRDIGSLNDEELWSLYSSPVRPIQFRFD